MAAVGNMGTGVHPSYVAGGTGLKYTTTTNTQNWNLGAGTGFSGPKIAADGTYTDSDDALLVEFFGPPVTAPLTKNAPRREYYNLIEAYNGNSVSMSTMIIDMLTETDTVWLRKILPWRKFEKAMSVNWDQWKFNNHTLDRGPEEGGFRTLTSQKSSYSSKFMRWSKAMRFQWEFYKTDQGKMHYAMSMRQLQNACIETHNCHVAHALVTSRPHHDVYGQWPPVAGAARSPMSQKEFINQLTHEIAYWDIVHKQQNGFGVAHQYLRQVMTDRGVSGANTTIVPQGVIEYAMYRPENTSFLLSGIPGNGPRDTISGQSLYGEIVESRPFRLGDDGPMKEDPFFRRRTIGEFFTANHHSIGKIEPQHYASWQRDVYVYDENKDDEVRIPLEDMLRNCALFEWPDAHHYGGGGDGEDDDRKRGYNLAKATREKVGRVSRHVQWKDHILNKQPQVKLTSFGERYFQNFLNWGDVFQQSGLLDTFVEQVCAKGKEEVRHKVLDVLKQGDDAPSSSSYDDDTAKENGQDLDFSSYEKSPRPQAGTTKKTSQKNANPFSQMVVQTGTKPLGEKFVGRFQKAGFALGPANQLWNLFAPLTAQITVNPSAVKDYCANGTAPMSMFTVDPPVNENDILPPDTTETRALFVQWIGGLDIPTKKADYKQLINAFTSAVPEGNQNRFFTELRATMKSAKDVQGTGTGSFSNNLDQKDVEAFAAALGLFDPTDKKVHPGAILSRRLPAEYLDLYILLMLVASNSDVNLRTSFIQIGEFFATDVVAECDSKLVEPKTGKVLGHLNWRQHGLKKAVGHRLETMPHIKKVYDAYLSRESSVLMRQFLQNPHYAIYRSGVHTAMLANLDPDNENSDDFSNTVNFWIITLAALETLRLEKVKAPKPADFLKASWQSSAIFKWPVLNLDHLVTSDKLTVWFKTQQGTNKLRELDTVIRKSINPSSNERALLNNSMKELEELTKTTEHEELKRALLIALFGAEIQDGTLFLICFKHDLVLPMQFILMRHMQTYLTGLMMWLVSGFGTGSTLVGHTLYTFDNDAIQRMITGTYSMWARCVIFNPENIASLPDVYCKSYVCGGGTKFWDPFNQNHLDVYLQQSNMSEDEMPDMHVVAVPCNWTPKVPYMDITGKFDTTICNSEGDEFHYPTWPIYQDIWRWSHKTLADTRLISAEDRWSGKGSRYNTVVCQGQTKSWVHSGNGQGEVKITRHGKGHWGSHVYPGCGLARNNKGERWYRTVAPPDVPNPMWHI